MSKLTSSQRGFLRSRAHSLKPVVSIGKNGVTDSVIQALDAALSAHELIKVRFLVEKERDRKREICAALQARAGCELAGSTGHVAIFYRPAPDPEKRAIVLPRK